MLSRIKKSLEVENKKGFLTQRHFWINRPRNEPLKEKRERKLSQRALEMMLFPWNGGMSPLKDENFPLLWQTQTMQRHQGAGRLCEMANWKIHPAVLMSDSPAFSSNSWAEPGHQWRVFLWALTRTRHWNQGTRRRPLTHTLLQRGVKPTGLLLAPR